MHIRSLPQSKVSAGDTHYSNRSPLPWLSDYFLSALFAQIQGNNDRSSCCAHQASSALHWPSIGHVLRYITALYQRISRERQRMRIHYFLSILVDKLSKHLSRHSHKYYREHLPGLAERRYRFYHLLCEPRTWLAPETSHQSANVAMQASSIGARHCPVISGHRERTLTAIYIGFYATVPP